MFSVPHKHRVREGQMASDDSWGNAGSFLIPHYKILAYFIFVQASDGEGWEHVSVSLHERKGRKLKDVERCPTWGEMCFIKNMFWSKDDAVIQYHPPETNYVSMHELCLHLWRPTDWVLPVPMSTLVGINGVKL